MLTDHYQNAYVTADIDRAVAMLVEQFGPVSEPRRIDGAAQMFRGTNGEGVGNMRIALVQVGKLQYELIQPVSGNVAIYADALVPDRVMTFHHVAMRTDDLEKMRAEVTRLGYPIVAEGEARGDIRFFYADARKSFGHYLEYVWAPASVWEGKRA